MNPHSIYTKTISRLSSITQYIAFQDVASLFLTHDNRKTRQVQGISWSTKSAKKKCHERVCQRGNEVRCDLHPDCSRIIPATRQESLIAVTVRDASRH